MAGRPTKRGLDYFSFDVDFFEDEKIEYITARFDEKGELISIKLLRDIYRSNGYYMNWNNDKATIFAKRAGRNISPALANDVVKELVKRGFFNENIFNSFGILTSAGIQKRYMRAVSERSEIEVIEDYWLINMPKTTSKQKILINRLNNSINQPNNSINRSDNAQSKEKESKAKKSKEVVVDTDNTGNGAYNSNADKSDDNDNNACSNFENPFKHIQNYYQQNFKNFLSSTAITKVMELLETGVEDALICRAIDKSIDSGAKNWTYAESMLNSCVLNGILTLKDYELSEANRNAAKAKSQKNWRDKPHGNNSTNDRRKKEHSGNSTKHDEITEGERLSKLGEAYDIDIGDTECDF